MFYRRANLPSRHERKTYDVPLETENQPADAVNTERGRGERDGEGKRGREIYERKKREREKIERVRQTVHKTTSPTESSRGGVFADPGWQVSERGGGGEDRGR